MHATKYLLMLYALLDEQKLRSPPLPETYNLFRFFLYFFATAFEVFARAFHRVASGQK